MQYTQYKPSGSLTAKDIDGTRVESVWRQKIQRNGWTSDEKHHENMRHLWGIIHSCKTNHVVLLVISHPIPTMAGDLSCHRQKITKWQPLWSSDMYPFYLHNFWLYPHHCYPDMPGSWHHHLVWPSHTRNPKFQVLNETSLAEHGFLFFFNSYIPMNPMTGIHTNDWGT